MSSVDSTASRSIFLPNKRESGKVGGSAALKRNSDVRKEELETFSKADSKVDIPDSISHALKK